jgi:hypothetical protein
MSGNDPTEKLAKKTVLCSKNLAKIPLSLDATWAP